MVNEDKIVRNKIFDENKPISEDGNCFIRRKRNKDEEDLNRVIGNNNIAPSNFKFEIMAEQAIVPPMNKVKVSPGNILAGYLLK